MKAGPVWDFNGYFMYYKEQLICDKCQYYEELFKDPAFVERVKEKWPAYKMRLDDNGGMTDYVDSLFNTVKQAALRDWNMWNWSSINNNNPEQQHTLIYTNLPRKINWLGEQIAAKSVTYDNRYTDKNEDFSGQDDQTSDFGFGF